MGYKHIPHSEKPAGVVAKRNARERRRVQTVNQAFVRLSKAVPQSGKVSQDNSSFVGGIALKVESSAAICMIYVTNYVKNHLQRGKRISKVRVLQQTIDYIQTLHKMVTEHDNLNS